MAAEVFVARVVIAGAHGPALYLRIPGHRQLPQHTPFIQAQIAAGVLARTDDVGHLSFQDVLFVSFRIQLVAPLVKAPLPLNHPVVTIRRGMVEVVLPGVVLDYVVR